MTSVPDVVVGGNLGGVPNGRRAILGLLALLVVMSAACTSSSKKASGATASSSAPNTTTALLSGAADAGLALTVSGDLTGTTDGLSTKVSRCTSMNGQFFFEGTVSLAGTELDVKISARPTASIEIDDLAGGGSWSAPNARDTAATVSIAADGPTSGSVTAVAIRDIGTTASTASPLTRLEVHGTYRC